VSVPESKGRAKRAYTPPKKPSKAKVGNPVWFVPVMCGLMIVGLLWVVTFYISGVNQYPVPQIGRWNLAAGFALMMAGFAMTTRWR
jgi:Cell division protein CrgA